jgi:hypothetical protein
MGFSTHRLSKVARTTCAPFTAVLAFSTLLTVVFVLYQPTRGPGDLQKLGWQSWATVSSKPITNGGVTTGGTTAQGNDTGSTNIPEGTDWWNVEAPEPEIESSSLPLDVWDPLMPHDTGRTCSVPFYSNGYLRLIPYSGRNCDREVLHRPWLHQWHVRPEDGYPR